MWGSKLGHLEEGRRSGVTQVGSPGTCGCNGQSPDRTALSVSSHRVVEPLTIEGESVAEPPFHGHGVESECEQDAERRERFLVVRAIAEHDAGPGGVIEGVTVLPSWHAIARVLVDPGVVDETQEVCVFRTR
jgi:hypothetical protein